MHYAGKPLTNQWRSYHLTGSGSRQHRAGSVVIGGCARTTVAAGFKPFQQEVTLINNGVLVSVRIVVVVRSQLAKLVMLTVAAAPLLPFT